MSGVALTAPDSETSPKCTRCRGIATPESDDNSAAAAARSAAGSVISQAARDVEIDVVAGEGDAGARFEHGEQHRQPVRIPADDGAARRAERRGRDQGLDLDQQRPRAFDAGEHGGARARGLAVAEEQLRRVGDLAQSLRRHLEHADLVGGAEAVLDRAQDAVGVAAIAFEIQHGVDHVLDHLRAGDLAVLGDVTDEQQRAAGSSWRGG